MRAPILLLIGLAGCGGVEDGDDPLDEEHGDIADGVDEGHLYQGLAVGGPWRLPAATRRIGNDQHVSYDSAPPFAGGANCAPGLTPGADMFRNHLVRYFPQISKIGGFVCREVAGLPGVMSQHGTGRALDVFVPTIDGNADNTKGDEIANWLVENAQAIGVQSVIWDRTIWKVDNSPRDSDYTGVHPHNDHVHVEITVEASHRNAPWYRHPFGPESCEEIGPRETVLSEDGSCFFAKGPDWRNDPGAGRGGSLSWTRAVARDKAKNWAQWSLPMQHRGEYRVEVFVDPERGRFSETRYQVRAGGLSYFPIVDQSSANGWTSLGSFLFEPGDGQFLRIFDNGSAPIEGALRIVADAIRVVPVAVDGCERLPNEGGVIRETSPCFSREGAPKGWRTMMGAGHGGSSIFISAKEGTTAVNWARWRVLVPAGRYEIAAFVDPAVGRFEAAHFKVFAEDELHPLRIDQGSADGWTPLGVFDFAGGSSQYVRLSDVSAEPIEGIERRIAVDAIRVRAAP